jgi:hypothetical protein
MGYLLVLITLKLIGEDILFYPFHGGHLGFKPTARVPQSSHSGNQAKIVL